MGGSSRFLSGRGTSANPPNRFEATHLEPDEDQALAETSSRVPTVLIDDSTRGILSFNDSPDVGFDVSINPYRGCEHGCIYCYARPTHEYLGMSAGLDFESKILVKREAAKLLRRELSADGWTPRVIAMSGVTDPYQPLERRLRLTRGCLEVLEEFRNPVAIVTKNQLVLRDRDVLMELSRFGAAVVYVSVTTLDPELSRGMEPRASLPAQRLRTIEGLAEAGIPVGVMVAPVIPGLTDHELPGILEQAAGMGARFAGYIPLRLPHGVGALFLDWLDGIRPGSRSKVEQRVRQMRGGRLTSSRFGERMTGEGPMAQMIQKFFVAACRRYGLSRGGPALQTRFFRSARETQLLLFE